MTDQPTFERGLAQIRSTQQASHVSSVVHLINPIAGTGVYCKPKVDADRLVATTATDPTCKRCLARREANRRRAHARAVEIINSNMK